MCDSEYQQQAVRRNLHHTWIHRISTKNLEKELGLDSMNNYIARRQWIILINNNYGMYYDGLGT